MNIKYVLCKYESCLCRNDLTGQIQVDMCDESIAYISENSI